MRRRASHATRRLLDLSLPRSARRAAGALGPQLQGLLRAGGRGLLSLGAGLLILVLIGLLVANFVGQVIQSARLEENRVALEAEVARLTAENTDLEGAVAYAESDVNVERIAREQLGYARAGETVLLPQMPTAVSPAEPAPVPAPPSAAPAPAQPNWQRWWHAFFPPTQPAP